MKSSNQETYEERNATVKVERIFSGDKTVQELVLELLKKRCETGGPSHDCSPR